MTGMAQSESRRYVVGPMATVGLPLGFQVEADALYRRFAYRTDSSDILGSSFTTRTTGNSWEFPILLRHGLAGGLYGAVGYAPRVVSGTSRYSGYTVTDLSGTRTPFSGQISAQFETSHGVVAAVGIEKRVAFLRIAPELRYTHWNQPATSFSGSRGYTYAGTQDQFDILVGIRFGGR